MAVGSYRKIERIFSLKRWLQDTMLGGGFAYAVRKQQ